MTDDNADLPGTIEDDFNAPTITYFVQASDYRLRLREDGMYVGERRQGDSWSPMTTGVPEVGRAAEMLHDSIKLIHEWQSEMTAQNEPPFPLGAAS